MREEREQSPEFVNITAGYAKRAEKILLLAGMIIWQRE